VTRGVLTHADEASGQAWVDLAAEPHLTFLIHGYNTSRQKGRRQLLDFAALLPSQQEGALVAVLWPGDHWVGPLSYSFEGRDADETARQLAGFIELHVAASTPLSFVGYSLGCRVALEAGKRLLGAYEVRQVCLLAAAVDDFSLASPHDYRRTTVASDRVAVLHSRHDLVLKLAYPAGDLLQAFLFFRDVTGFALGYGGPKPHSGRRVPGNVVDRRSRLGHGHFDYMPSAGGANDKQRRAAELTDGVLSGR
jgi:hypothetical protein